MFDTHVNLHAEAFAEDLDDVLSRARAVGVRRFLAICDRLDRFADVHAIASAHNDIWCTAGVHPHNTKDFPDLSTDELVALAALDEVVAVGETGLDLHYGYSPLEDQIRSLRIHLEAAQRSCLPVVLHTREADDLMGDILEEAHAAAPFTPLLHCYTGGERLAQRGLALGAYVSVSGIISFKNAKEVRAVITDVPMDRLILETDCPYLAPVPHRGRRNEPAYLPDVARALAAIHDMDVEAVLETTEANALRLFGKVS